MIAIILLMGQAIAATLLDTTYGVVGRNVEVLDGAEQAYALVDQQDWSAAAQGLPLVKRIRRVRRHLGCGRSVA